MAMKAQLFTDTEGNFIIQLSGNLNYENSSPLQKKLEELIEQNPLCHITLNLYHVEFVGSSGIGAFVDTINLINQKRAQSISLTNVKSEFIKVFKLYHLKNLEQIIMDYRPNEQELVQGFPIDSI